MGPSSRAGSGLAPPDRLPYVAHLRWFFDVVRDIVEATRTHTILDVMLPHVLLGEAILALEPVALGDVGTPKTKFDAPEVIQIPPGLQQGLDQAYEQTLQDGLESGGTLVRDKTTGEVVFVNAGGVDRTEVSFRPDYAVDTSRYEVLGVAHTHPPANNGLDTAFSPDDFVHALNADTGNGGQVNTMLLKSGDTQFLLVRTAATARNVDADEVRRLGYEQARQLVKAGHSMAEATQMANKFLAQRYGFVYYESRGGGAFERVSR